MLAAGADAMKLFPAEAASPAGAARRCARCCRRRRWSLPVGGIDAGNMAAWLEAGADGFGIGSAIYKAADSAATVGSKAAALVRAIT